MAFNTTSSNIAGAGDVDLSNPVSTHFLKYNPTYQKWQNAGLSGYAALATGGGSETVSSLSTSGSATLDLATANVFNVTLTGNTTYIFSGATNGRACSFSLYLRQDTTGSRTVTWPTSVLWAGGTPPTLTTAANAVDILVFESINGGTSWYGSLVGSNFS